MFVSARANRRGGIRSYPVLWHEASVCNMYNELLWEQIVMSVLNLLYSYLILIWHKLSDSQGKLHTGDLGTLSPPPVFDSINWEYTLLWEQIMISVSNLLHSYLILIWHKLSDSQWKLHTGDLGTLSLPPVFDSINREYTLLWELIVMSVLNLLNSYLILIWHKLSDSQWKLHTGNLGKLSLSSVCIWFNKQRLHFEHNKIVSFFLEFSALHHKWCCNSFHSFFPTPTWS